ncbi:MAG: phosphopantothenoylcysteine decarboxylase [Phycisphaerae bacterium]|nr:phosphopantothenoylcysteine decarboxylase [Phycisphaerae bacterium]
MALNHNILLGVTGGVAAYKAVDLASRLTAAGAAVRTIMTESACQLVGPKSLEAVTHQPVYVGLWAAAQDHDIEHIRLAEWADLVVVAPATANCLAKIAGGICDDLLSTVLCVCWRKPVLLAPAMNTQMWSNPIVQRNVRTLTDLGLHLVGPESGRLACGQTGIGRMAEPEQILQAIQDLATGHAEAGCGS